MLQPLSISNSVPWYSEPAIDGLRLAYEVGRDDAHFESLVCWRATTRKTRWNATNAQGGRLIIRTITNVVKQKSEGMNGHFGAHRSRMHQSNANVVVSGVGESSLSAFTLQR